MTESVDETDRPIASVVIPAHNEARVIGRLLSGLIEHDGRRLEIIVVCNGCTDDTAAVAASYDPAIRVIELPEPSKRAALRRGDAEATSYPRLFIDADVEISARSVEQLVDALAGGIALAAAPERIVPRDGVSHLVGWYYDIWEQLPQVRSGLFGRGVIALSEAGNERVRALPSVMGDDLVASEEFTGDERVIVPEASVVVHPPRTMRDLHRRRIRAATGNAQADRVGLRRSSSITSPRTLVALVADQPSLLTRLPVFLGSALASRIAAARVVRTGDYDTWLRDESSRTRSG